MKLRLPRFKRASDISAIELTQRDQEIIRLVYRHRFLRSSQIVFLIGGSQQAILRRLQLLYHHGYLERPRAQIEYYHQGGSRRIAYGLGNKGGTLLKQELGITIPDLSWGEKNRSVKGIFLEHALLVSEVMVAIELACRRNNKVRFIHSDELARMNPELSIFRWSVNINSQVKLGIVPDRVFGLEFPDLAGVQQQAYFFLEADRGTMPVKRKQLSQTSFYRKLLAYEATWSQGIHRTQFGFHRFRVLTVTTSAERVKSLVEACSNLQRGHGLFLFADRTILENPDILNFPWQTGRPDKSQDFLLN